jgi:hypothetical protein
MPLASPPTTPASPSALSVPPAMVVGEGALLLVDLMVLRDEAPEQNVEEPPTPADGGVDCRPIRTLPAMNRGQLRRDRSCQDRWCRGRRRRRPPHPG